MNNSLVLPLDDVRVASERNIRFKVALKDDTARRWLTVADDVKSLVEAAELIEELNAEQDRAIFVQLTSGGIFYWNSAQPRAFNSQLIHSEHYISMYKKTSRDSET